MLFTWLNWVQYPTLCEPMDYSTPGFPVRHQLQEPAQAPVHWVGDAIQSSHPLVLFSSCLQSCWASGSFLVSQFFALGGQSIGASTLASVLAMNIQDWFPLGWTGLISLQSMRLKSSPTPQFKSINSQLSTEFVSKSRVFVVQPFQIKCPVFSQCNFSTSASF